MLLYPTKRAACLTLGWSDASNSAARISLTSRRRALRMNPVSFLKRNSRCGRFSVGAHQKTYFLNRDRPDKGHSYLIGAGCPALPLETGACGLSHSHSSACLSLSSLWRSVLSLPPL